jgi:hypothetical protein
VTASVKKLASKSKTVGLKDDKGRYIAKRYFLSFIQLFFFPRCAYILYYHSSAPVFGAKEHRSKTNKRKNTTNDIEGLAGSASGDMKKRKRSQIKKITAATPRQWKDNKREVTKTSLRFFFTSLFTTQCLFSLTAHPEHFSQQKKTKGKPKHLKRQLAAMEAKGVSSDERAKFASRRALEAKRMAQKKQRMNE